MVVKHPIVMLELEYVAVFNKVINEFQNSGIIINHRTYAFARAVAQLIQWRNAQIQTTLDQQSLNNAVGSWLDNIGLIRGIPRLVSETDEAYRNRLKQPIVQVSTMGYYSRRLKEKYSTDDIAYVQEVGTSPPNIVVYVGNSTKTAIAAPTISAYQAYLQSDGVRLVNDAVTVENLTYVTVDVTATVYTLPTSTLNVAHFVDVLSNYLDRVVIPGQDITRNKLIALLGADNTVGNVTISVPSSDVTINNGQIAKKGTLTVTVSAAT